MDHSTFRPLSLPFNPKPSTIMHIDLNSCFATVEQQADPKLRGKPIAVAAYTGSSGCIVAPSVEAKQYGVRVGHRVRDGQMLCPNLIVLPPDPPKYRAVHLQLRKLFGQYTNNYSPKSIDEFVLDLEGYPAYQKGMKAVAKEIKNKIKVEIGEWLTVSVGIGPNRFLAKTAAGLNKPNGLDEISKDNYLQTYQTLKLMDLCGIKVKNTTRLNQFGIYTVLDFYNAEISTLKAAFHSIVGYYWYLRLKGWEIDDIEFGRRSYGNSYALPDNRTTSEELAPILSKLVHKMGLRLRKAGYSCQGVHVSLSYRDGYHWHHGEKTDKIIFDSKDIYKRAFKIMCCSPHSAPVSILAVSVFNLSKLNILQLSMFENTLKKEKLVKAVDQINEKWGQYVITPARMLGTQDNIPDRIAFGGVKELEELIQK